MDDFDRVFFALGDPTRRRLIEVLSAGPKPVGRLAVRLQVSQSAVSQHLKVLLRAGLATSHPVGRQRYWALKRRALLQVSDWVEWVTGGDLPAGGRAASCEVQATVSDADRAVAKQVIRDILKEDGGSMEAEMLELLAGSRLYREGMEGGHAVAKALVAEMLAAQGG